MMLFKVLLLVSVVLLLVVPQVRSESDIDKDFQAMLDRLDDPVPDPLTPEERAQWNDKENTPPEVLERIEAKLQADLDEALAYFSEENLAEMMKTHENLARHTVQSFNQQPDL